MATVTDTVTHERYEGVSGDLLAYYRAEGERFEIVEDEAEQAAAFPQVWQDGERVELDEPAESTDSTATSEQSAGDGTDGKGDPPSSPFVLPEGQYLANDGVVYDQSAQRVEPQPTPEQLASLQH